uniref:Leucine-rich repeat-containing N-terminal plant-type domain-containing protein n=1 Tax=Oryza rufipogon TaxID=4529 RepID=A0A0E0QSM2_ORYRU
MSISSDAKLALLLNAAPPFDSATAAKPCASSSSSASGLHSFVVWSAHGHRHQRPIAWNSSTPAYDWVGFACDAANATVLGLRLPGVSLIGFYASGCSPFDATTSSVMSQVTSFPFLALSRLTSPSSRVLQHLARTLLAGVLRRQPPALR